MITSFAMRDRDRLAEDHALCVGNQTYASEEPGERSSREAQPPLVGLDS
jgi:hypothetical protein